jgi:hypothetical protein
MRRYARWLTLGAVVASAAVAVWRPAAPPLADARHSLLHLSCPPGSHGPARSEGVVRSLIDARSKSTNQLEAP